MFLKHVGIERSWSVQKPASDVTPTARDLYLSDCTTSVNKWLTLFHCVSLPYHDTTISYRMWTQFSKMINIVKLNERVLYTPHSSKIGASPIGCSLMSYPGQPIVSWRKSKQPQLKLERRSPIPFSAPIIIRPPAFLNSKINETTEF